MAEQIESTRVIHFNSSDSESGYFTPSHDCAAEIYSQLYRRFGMEVELYPPPLFRDIVGEDVHNEITDGQKSAKITFGRCVPFTQKSTVG